MQTTLAADEAGGDRRRAARAVPGARGPRQRRHLLRHHQPPARGARDRRRVRRGAGARARRTRRTPCAWWRRRERAGTPAYLIDGADGHRARLARRARRSSGSPPGRRRRRAVVGQIIDALSRPRPGRGQRARRRHRIHPLRPSQGVRSNGCLCHCARACASGTYLMRQKLARRDKFPLLVELEPLFACNLKCAGCGKIQQPHDAAASSGCRSSRRSARSRSAARRWCRSPAASRSCTRRSTRSSPQLIARKKFVFLCTNALLIPKKLDKFTAVAVLLLGGPHRRAAGAARRVGLQGGRVRRGGRGDQGRASGAGSRSTRTPRSSTPTPRRP